MSLPAPLSATQKIDLAAVAATIRGLSMDAIEAANSGHPGLPLGCAEIGAYLYGVALNHDPKHPDWVARDRFVLSAGHGSMLLYSALHLSGFNLSLSAIQRFRQLHSPCAGHPEYGEAPGIEATTGPLGQGVGMAVGMSLGNHLIRDTFHLQNTGLLDPTVYVLAGDGCMMEGVTAESASLAGHLGLGNLVVIYDANAICLDGPTTECFTENVGQRFMAYGWHVLSINGHDFDAIDTAIQTAKTIRNQPVLIIAKTTIGKGSPTYQGTSEVHGKALGAKEVALTKAAHGIPESPLFFVPDSVRSYFKNRRAEQSAMYANWQSDFAIWRAAHPELAAQWDSYLGRQLPVSVAEAVAQAKLPDNAATRKSSQGVLDVLHDTLPNLISGSADLSCSDNTWMKKGGVVSRGQFAGRNIKYGVREFAMGTIANGLALQGMIRPFCGTFLTFSDYMRNAIRLAALMHLPVIYQFTHDSILLGEDGPTHQPVEHLASLRAMPNLTVIRPGDANEVKGAWLAALHNPGPTALILSRQNLKDLSATSIAGTQKGAYVVVSESGNDIDYCILTTGSELALATEVATGLATTYRVRVVSMPSWELFLQQPPAYQTQTIPPTAKQFVVIEAQSSFGWHRWTGRDPLLFTVDHFGKSAPAKDLSVQYGLTTDAILSAIRAHR